MPTKKNIESPELLWSLWIEYKAWCEDNPYESKEITTGGKNGDTVKVKYTDRAPVFEGFEIYLADKNIIRDLGHYESNKDGRYKEYVTIIKKIKKDRNGIVKSGALSGVFKENIAARITGLADKTENETNVKLEQITGLKVISTEPDPQ